MADMFRRTYRQGHWVQRGKQESNTRRDIRALGLAIVVLLFGTAVSSAQERVIVFAAASMQTALAAVADAWSESHDAEIVLSFAATSALARQIAQGAPADIFISADLDWMTYVEERDLITAESRIGLVGNRLVLIAPAGAVQPLSIDTDLDLVGLLGGGRLALADPVAVPAGRYAQTALKTLGLWDGVVERLAPAENVRAALAFVSRGEAPLGIVYATDDIADPAVDAVGIFPEATHPPIIYAAAMLTDSGDAAAEFLVWLQTDPAQCIFAAHGFTPLGTDGAAIEPVDCSAG